MKERNLRKEMMKISRMLKGLSTNTLRPRCRLGLNHLIKVIDSAIDSPSHASRDPLVYDRSHNKISELEVSTW